MTQYLDNVCEYQSVKDMTQHPKLMQRAFGQVLLLRSEAMALIDKMVELFNEDSPIVRWGERISWAIPERNEIQLNLKDLNIEVVLHELAHLWAPEEYVKFSEEDDVSQPIYHGKKFTRTLDLLLVAWDKSRQYTPIKQGEPDFTFVIIRYSLMDIESGCHYNEAEK